MHPSSQSSATSSNLTTFQLFSFASHQGYHSFNQILLHIPRFCCYLQANRFCQFGFRMSIATLVWLWDGITYWMGGLRAGINLNRKKTFPENLYVTKAENGWRDSRHGTVKHPLITGTLPQDLSPFRIKSRSQFGRHTWYIIGHKIGHSEMKI